jgi:DnaJ family protein A protein 2
LYCNSKIDLLTALTGGSVIITHISGEVLKVDIIPGEIIKPNSLKVVTGSGMPRKNMNSHGDLVIHFEVEFPDKDQLNEKSAELLAKALPPRPALNIPESTIPVEKVLSDYNPHQHAYKTQSYPSKRKRKRPSSGPTDSTDNSSLDSEELSNHGDGAQCAPQ